MDSLGSIIQTMKPYILLELNPIILGRDVEILTSVAMSSCRIQGTDGSIFHPDVQKNETLYIFNKVNRGPRAKQWLRLELALCECWW